MKNSRSLATILVVEDEIVTQRLTRKILEERGYEVIVAADGVEALMALGKMNFDLIVCDINMPNMDGFKLLEFLNQKDILIPVIFVTIREDVEDEIKGLALGAKDYIRKPVNRDLLLLRIRKALNK
jgi:DNA-binding response OmpR family regulator